MDDANDDGSALRLKLLFVSSSLLLASLARMWLMGASDSIGQILALASAVVVSAPILVSTLTAIRESGFAATEFYMDQFVVLALAACLATGRYVTGAIVAIILVLGQLLEERAVIGVEGALSRLKALTRTRAQRVKADGSSEEVEASELSVGDIARIRPGDYVPADARVVKGNSLIDQANITGESLPVEAAEGSEIFAGTVNLTGLLEARVEKSGANTTLARVQQIIEDAKSSEAPIIRLAEDCARYYTPLILLVALSVFFFTGAVERAIAVLIVSIPCAFVLASPSAMVGAIASASRLGMLIKSARALELGRAIDTVVFDKTGTLTEGKLWLENVWTYSDANREEALALASALERHSSHPVAAALCRAWDGAVEEVADLAEASGRGVSGVLDGSRIAIGRRSWLEEQGVSVAEDPPEAERLSLIHLARDGRHVASFGLGDRLRPEAREAIERLRYVGVERFVMLTGDRYPVAAAIAKAAGLTEFHADCLPEDKHARLLALKESGATVLVVGDGLNDAPMLAAGDLGVAMGALGNDVAVHAADVALMSSDLRRLADLLELARRTVAIVNQNLLCGFLFIFIAVTLSSAGFVNPILAAFFHEFSAFFVIFNSARLLRFDGLDDELDGAAEQLESDEVAPRDMSLTPEAAA